MLLQQTGAGHNLHAPWTLGSTLATLSPCCVCVCLRCLTCLSMVYHTCAHMDHVPVYTSLRVCWIQGANRNSHDVCIFGEPHPEMLQHIKVQRYQFFRTAVIVQTHETVPIVQLLNRATPLSTPWGRLARRLRAATSEGRRCMEFLVRFGRHCTAADFGRCKIDDDFG